MLNFLFLVCFSAFPIIGCYILQGLTRASSFDFISNPVPAFVPFAGYY